MAQTWPPPALCALPRIAPHLVMMAFLDRGSMAAASNPNMLGRGRMDLYLATAASAGLELNVCDGKPDPLTGRLEQLDGYLNKLELSTGWLVIFDQRAGLPDISERTTVETVASPAGRQITLIRG
ncbi:MAG: hypothetical protein R2911_16890 [Caldilineaceae bacterium]